MFWKIFSHGSRCERLVSEKYVTALFFTDKTLTTQTMWQFFSDHVSRIGPLQISNGGFTTLGFDSKALSNNSDWISCLVPRVSHLPAPWDPGNEVAVVKEHPHKTWAGKSTNHRRSESQRMKLQIASLSHLSSPPSKIGERGCTQANFREIK